MTQLTASYELAIGCESIPLLSLPRMPGHFLPGGFMPTMDYATLSFQQYQPHDEDLCSLCGTNFGKAAMIEGRNNIHICLRCVEVLADIKNEREAKKRDEVETALRTCLAGTGAGITHLAAKCIYDAIAAGKIPGIRIE